jgi:hypothetical protein
MVLKFWLIVDESEGVSVRKRTPASGALRENEIAIPLTLRVPDSWFSRHVPIVTIDVPAPTVSAGDIAIETGEPFASVIDDEQEEGQP